MGEYTRKEHEGLFRDSSTPVYEEETKYFVFNVPGSDFYKMS